MQTFCFSELTTQDCNWIDSSFALQDVKKIFMNIQHDDADDDEEDSGTEVSVDTQMRYSFF
jgi:hypothetical protein